MILFIKVRREDAWASAIDPWLASPDIPLGVIFINTK